MIKKWENFPEYPGQTADEYTSRNIPKPLTGETIAEALKKHYDELHEAPAAPQRRRRTVNEKKHKAKRERKQMKHKTKKNNLRGKRR